VFGFGTLLFGAGTSSVGDNAPDCPSLPSAHIALQDTTKLLLSAALARIVGSPRIGAPIAPA
jgi:hypothetical protein